MQHLPKTFYQKHCKLKTNIKEYHAKRRQSSKDNPNYVEEEVAVIRMDNNGQQHNYAVAKQCIALKRKYLTSK